MYNILNYGGGRQTVAMLVAIKRGIIPRPDRVVIADTGREKTSTWDYLEEVGQPFAQSIGLTIEFAPRSLAYVDLFSKQGDLLIPVFHQTGKFRTFCSGEWKTSVINRYFGQQGIKPSQRTHWIGFSLDEQKRVKGNDGRRFPLIEAMLTKVDCLELIKSEGLPTPLSSACWMCPNMHNAEWREIRDLYPDDFKRACELDEFIREENKARGELEGKDFGGVYLHHSLNPLRDADLDADDRKMPSQQCALGNCFI